MNTEQLLTRLRDLTGRKYVSGRCIFCGDPGNFNGVCTECWKILITIIEEEIKHEEGKDVQ